MMTSIFFLPPVYGYKVYENIQYCAHLNMFRLYYLNGIISRNENLLLLATQTLGHLRPTETL